MVGIHRHLSWPLWMGFICWGPFNWETLSVWNCFILTYNHDSLIIYLTRASPHQSSNYPQVGLVPPDTQCRLELMLKSSRRYSLVLSCDVCHTQIRYLKSRGMSLLAQGPTAGEAFFSCARPISLFNCFAPPVPTSQLHWILWTAHCLYNLPNKAAQDGYPWADKIMKEKQFIVKYFCISEVIFLTLVYIASTFP